MKEIKLPKYKTVSEELTLIKGVFLKGTQLILPYSSLRVKVIAVIKSAVIAAPTVNRRGGYQLSHRVQI